MIAEKKPTKEERRRALLEEKRIDEKRRRLDRAGVDTDPRTAQGARSLKFEIGGQRDSLRVSINHLGACLKGPGERTDERVLAWGKVDELQQRLHTGLIPAAKYEKGVDSSALPGVQMARLQAVSVDRALQELLGRDAHELLVLVVFHQHSYSEIAENMVGGTPTPDDRKFVGRLFKQALDNAAAFFGITGRRSTFGQRANDAVSVALWRQEAEHRHREEG